MNPSNRASLIGTSKPNYLKRYGMAVLLAFAALLLRVSLHPVLGRKALYSTFLLGAAASAGIGGFWPGMLSAVVGLFLSRFLIPGPGFFHLEDPADPYVAIRYLISTLFLVSICGALFKQRERAREAERQVRASERVYHALGESIPFGIWTNDARGRNLYASDSFLKLIGMTQEECSSDGWQRALHPDDAEETAAAWLECVKKNEAWDRELRFLGSDGKYHPVLARGVPVRDEKGRIVCWAGIHLDIHRLKEAQAGLKSQAEALERSNQELEQFAFVASHDLQEPLRMVNIYTELLLRQIGDGRSQEIDRFASVIHEGVARMSRLIRDLLSVSRVIHSDLEPRRVDADSALQEALAACGRVIEESGAQITFDRLPAVVGEEAPMAQIFQNLISNAIRYRRASVPPQVRISVETRDGEGIFLVEDNGIGFDPVYAETIFGLFKRLHRDEYPGTGLGLAICRRIVERHGGKIWAEGNPDEGAKFFFSMPLADSAKASQAN